LGIGDWAQSPIPNPQSPIPNPQSPMLKFFENKKIKEINILTNKYFSFIFFIINLKL
jgi:hypothetical protein